MARWFNGTNRIIGVILIGYWFVAGLAAQGAMCPAGTPSGTVAVNVPFTLAWCSRDVDKITAATLHYGTLQQPLKAVTQIGTVYDDGLVQFTGTATLTSAGTYKTTLTTTGVNGESPQSTVYPITAVTVTPLAPPKLTFLPSGCLAAQAGGLITFGGVDYECVNGSWKQISTR